MACSTHAAGKKDSRSSANSARYSRAKRCGSSRRCAPNLDSVNVGFMRVDGARHTNKSGESWPKWFLKSSYRTPLRIYGELILISLVFGKLIMPRLTDD